MGTEQGRGGDRECVLRTTTRCGTCTRALAIGPVLAMLWLKSCANEKDHAVFVVPLAPVRSCETFRVSGSIGRCLPPTKESSQLHASSAPSRVCLTSFKQLISFLNEYVILSTFLRGIGLLIATGALPVGPGQAGELGMKSACQRSAKSNMPLPVTLLGIDACQDVRTTCTYKMQRTCLRAV